jgi:hypothetical protein
MKTRKSRPKKRMTARTREHAYVLLARRASYESDELAGVYTSRPLAERAVPAAQKLFPDAVGFSVLPYTLDAAPKREGE